MIIRKFLYFYIFKILYTLHDIFLDSFLKYYATIFFCFSILPLRIVQKIKQKIFIISLFIFTESSTQHLHYRSGATLSLT